MKTKSEIMSAPAEEVAKVLTAFNAWRLGDYSYKRCYEFLEKYDGRVIGLYIDRAVQLLNMKGEQE